MKRLAALLLLVFALAKLVVAQSTIPVITEATIRGDMALHVCKNKERLEAVKSLFKSKGVSDAELTVENHDGVENLVFTKKGKKADEIIVIGAHYDKVSNGCGALDNWTGIVVLANLIAEYKGVATDKTLIFVAFGREEEGLLGARMFVRQIPKENRGQYCSMVNLDSFGLTYPNVISNLSNGNMTEFAKQLAEEVKMPFSSPSFNAGADSSAFNEKDIPAITLSGMTSKWPEYLHTTKDKIDSVNQQAVFVGYNFALLFLSRIEPKPCGVFKKEKKS